MQDGACMNVLCHVVQVTAGLLLGVADKVAGLLLLFKQKMMQNFSL